MDRSVCCSSFSNLFLGNRYRRHLRIPKQKILVPVQILTINAATLTLLGVAMKMSLDLNTDMHHSSDQLAKLSSTVLMCIVIDNFKPSLGP
ncbi:hypothetical protein ACSBR1_031230 [Camellia fascicularis]